MIHYATSTVVTFLVIHKNLFLEFTRITRNLTTVEVAFVVTC